MSTEPRYLMSALHLLDRQLVDRAGHFAGNVDDLQLAVGDDGEWRVTGILAGPGTLLYRMRHQRIGDWVRRLHRAARADAVDEDPAFIAVSLVADITHHVRLAADADELGTSSVQHWLRDHVIRHIPGGRR